MTERLQRALQHINEISPAMQDELASQIEDMLAPRIDLPTYAGSMPDDAEESLLRMRREVPPTPPMDEQLKWLEEEE